MSLHQSLGFRIPSRDVKQADIKFYFRLKIQLTIKPPKVPNLVKSATQPSYAYLRALNRVNRLFKSPRYWWPTFERCNTENQEMDQSTFAVCLFNQKSGWALIRFVTILFDDTLTARSHEFYQIENWKFKAFEVKSIDYNLALKFCGVKEAIQGSVMMRELYGCIDTFMKKSPSI